MSNITNTNKTTAQSILTNPDLVTEYLYGLDSVAEATSEDSDDSTALFNATDIFWRSTTDNTANQNDTYYAGNGDDELFGGAGNDYIVGRYGDDDIFGGSGRDTLFGGAGKDDLYGGTGIDTAIYDEQLSGATITNNSGKFTVSVVSGDDTLVGVERLKFSNTSVALDLDGNAGEVAKLIGAVIGPDRVADKALVGLALDYIDNGGNLTTLVDIALNYMGATTTGVVVDLLYTNLTGTSPTQWEHDYYVSLIENTDLTANQLTLLACETDLNAQNINLVGLTGSGIEYTPYIG